MNVETTKTIPIVMRIPAELGLTKQEVETLETRWQADLTKAAGGSGSKIKWSIKLEIKIGNE